MWVCKFDKRFKFSIWLLDHLVSFFVVKKTLVIFWSFFWRYISEVTLITYDFNVSTTMTQA